MQHGSDKIATLAAAGLGTVSVNKDNKTGRGCIIVIDVTALSGTTPSLVVTLKGRDPVSGKFWTILASASITATGTTILRVYPGLTAAANLVANDVLPENYTVDYTVGGTTPGVTATISVITIL